MGESTAGSTGRIFISYRRDETAYPAGWLFDRLAQHFGPAQIFKDIDSIKLGDDFVQVISSAVGSCDVLLALIGDQWLTATDSHGRRRLDDPDDFVRLEIEAALERNVRIIPILVDGASLPRAEELPAGLIGLVRRQALELSPNRFEYDTNRLLKVLDMTLATVRTVIDDPDVISTAAAPQAVQNTSENDVPVAGIAPGLLAGDDSSTTQPAVHHSPESTLAPGKASASDEGRPRKNLSDLGRSRTLRRLVIISFALVGLLAIYLIIQLSTRVLPTTEENNGTQSSASNEFTEEGPWRLVVRNDGSSDGCTLTLVNRDTNETWSNGYPVHDTASFVIPQAGTFRWSAESGCTVVTRPGPGSLTLPAVVDGVGTSDAFKPPAMITVSVKDFHGNARCDLELRDVATGTIVDIGELNKQKDSATLQPQGRPLVYLVNDACGVQVSPG
jgi:hypothetical protein